MLVAGLLLAMLVVGVLAIRGAVVERQRLAAGLPSLRKDLAWMQRHAAEIQQLRSPGDTAPGLDVGRLDPAVVERLLRGTGLESQLTELKPGANHEVIIAFSEVSYPRLISFLFSLDRGRGGSIRRASITRVQDKAGMVSASITLEGGP